MQRALQLLADQPLLLLAVLLALGAALGHVKVKEVRLGPAAVLFAALGVSAWAASLDVELEIPEVVGVFGLVLFTYTVGVVSGTHFFSSLRRGWPTMLVVAAALGLVGALAVGVGRALGIEPGTVAGAYAGALTNTPALAAASARADDPATAHRRLLDHLPGRRHRHARRRGLGPAPARRRRRVARRSPTSPCGSRSTSRSRWPPSRSSTAARSAVTRLKREDAARTHDRAGAR